MSDRYVDEAAGGASALRDARPHWHKLGSGLWRKLNAIAPLSRFANARQHDGRNRGAGLAHPDTLRPFNLQRSFALTGFVSIAVVSVLLAWSISDLVAERMLERDAAVTRQFVQSTLESMPAGAASETSYKSLAYVSFFDDDASTAVAAEFDAFFRRLAEMPDVIRAQAYAADGMRIWSTNPKMVGILNVSTNNELRAAIQGTLSAHFTPTIWGMTADERTRLHPEVRQFEETYFPIWDKTGQVVIGAVELYKMSDQLYTAVEQSKRTVFAGVLAGGVVLYGVLFWIVRRAARVIEQQRTSLVAAERLASVGEMASAVAHNIRNPLAAIRSSCEVWSETQCPTVHPEPVGMLEEVERAEGAIRGLLRYAEVDAREAESVDLTATLRELIRQLSGSMQQQSVKLDLQVPVSALLLSANRTLLHEVLETVLVNALQAMPDGGTLSVQAFTHKPDAHVSVRVHDTGVGIAPEIIKNVFRPFFTTKGHGLGLGLAFARRIVERHGGTIRLDSAQPGGTTVILNWPAAGKA